MSDTSAEKAAALARAASAAMHASGRQAAPGWGTVWNGPAWSQHHTDRPSDSPTV